MTRLRRLRVLKELAVLIADLTRARFRGQLTDAYRAQEIRALIEHMGGLWIKFGQLIALRHDAFSQELCDELSNLQDTANGFPLDIMRARMEEELGAPLDEVFSRFDEQPVAAASIAQVHRARLARNGVEVAVKVQKPSARDMFIKDLAMIRSFVRLLNIFRVLPYFNWDEALKEMRGIIDEELDYRVEAGSIADMRKTLKKHKVFAPKVFLKECNTVMLTMEFLHGVFMTDYLHMMRRDPARVEAWCRENGIKPKVVASKLLRSQLRQIFEDNLFHGDLHPGNILLFRDNRYGLIDFGSVGTLDANFVARYRMSMSALAAGEYERAADLLLLMTPRLPSVDLTQVRDEMTTAWRNWAGRTRIKNAPYHERSLANAGDEVNKVSLKYKIQPNWTLLKIGRAWSTLDASLAHLNPQLSYLKVIKRYGKESGRRRFRELPARLMAIPATFEEISVVLGPQLRSSALALQATASKSARMLSMGLSILGLGLAVGVIYLSWVYLSQHHDGTWIEDAASNLLTPIFGPRLEEWRYNHPEIHRAGWMFITGIAVVTFMMLRRFVRILREPDAARRRVSSI